MQFDTMRMEVLITPTRVEARPDYHIYLEFSDGTKGEIDLSNLAGKGVFRVWEQPGFFEQVRIGEHREIKWNEQIELCADSLYLQLTGKAPHDLFPALEREQPHA